MHPNDLGSRVTTIEHKSCYEPCKGKYGNIEKGEGEEEERNSSPPPLSRHKCQTNHLAIIWYKPLRPVPLVSFFWRAYEAAMSAFVLGNRDKSK